MTGHFNDCKRSKSLSNVYQYVTCPTRHAKCLDLRFGSVKEHVSASVELHVVCPISTLFICFCSTNPSLRGTSLRDWFQSGQTNQATSSRPPPAPLSRGKAPPPCSYERRTLRSCAQLVPPQLSSAEPEPTFTPCFLFSPATGCHDGKALLATHTHT